MNQRNDLRVVLKDIEKSNEGNDGLPQFKTGMPLGVISDEKKPPFLSSLALLLLKSIAFASLFSIGLVLICMIWGIVPETFGLQLIGTSVVVFSVISLSILIYSSNNKRNL